ncbi:MAG: hypothetical protein ACRC4N_00140 [Gammaproteobacteria bacterium]
MNYVATFKSPLVERLYRYCSDRDDIVVEDTVIHKDNVVEKMGLEKILNVGENVFLRGRNYKIKAWGYTSGYPNVAITYHLDRPEVIYMNTVEDAKACIGMNDEAEKKHYQAKELHIEAEVSAMKHTQINIQNSKNNKITISGNEINIETDDKIGILSPPERSQDSTSVEDIGFFSTKGLVAEDKEEKVLPLTTWKEMEKEIKEENPSLFKKFMKWMKG